VTNSIALPRIKTKAKRKRRKPMPPKLKFLIFWVVWCCFWLAWDVIDYVMGPETKDLIYAGIQAACLCFWWPQFIREWNAWRKDNEGD